MILLFFLSYSARGVPLVKMKFLSSFMVQKGVGRAEGTFSKLRMSDLAAFLKRGPCAG